MDQSFSARPFHFDTVFEASPTPFHEGLDEALSAAALQSELKALRAAREKDIAAAYAQGAADAEARVRAERDEALLAAMDALQAGWEEFDEARSQMQAQLTAEARDPALAIAEKLAAQAFADAPVAAIDAAIGRVLKMIERGQEVHIRVHPDLVEATQERIAARQSMDRRKLNLFVDGDAATPVGDAQLSWDSGGLSLDAASRRAAIEQELAMLTGLGGTANDAAVLGNGDIDLDDDHFK